MRRTHIAKALIASICLFSCAALAGASDDAFGAKEKVEGTHFVVYYDPHVNLSALLQQLAIGPGDALLVNEPATKKGDFPAALDILYSRVSGTLDINLYDLQCNLKICRDDNHLREVSLALFNRDAKAPSFYVYDLNTIYISAEHFTKEILGHEIAHAIISHYFVVPPPEKVQEILCGYVEYELRKLPR